MNRKASLLTKKVSLANLSHSSLNEGIQNDLSINTAIDRMNISLESYRQAQTESENRNSRDIQDIKNQISMLVELVRSQRSQKYLEGSSSAVEVLDFDQS